MDDILKKIQLIVSEYEYHIHSSDEIINDVNVRFGEFDWSSPFGCCQNSLMQNSFVISIIVF